MTAAACKLLKPWLDTNKKVSNISTYLLIALNHNGHHGGGGFLASARHALSSWTYAICNGNHEVLPEAWNPHL